MSEAYVEGLYSRLDDKSAKLKKESLQENLEQFSINPLFETCPIIKVEILQVQRRLKWKDFIFHQIKRMSTWKGDPFWKLLVLSSNLHYFKKLIPLSSSNIWKALKVPSRNILIHSMPSISSQFLSYL
jgi:hypothetical protein